MNIRAIHIVWIVSVILLTAACRKDKQQDSGPSPFLGGRVVLINSDTPVPNALVRFMKWDNSGDIFSPMTYILVGTDTTDENGRFDVPKGTDATMVIAYGPQDVFTHESQEGSIEAYWSSGGEMKLQLVPPAWIKVSVLDTFPLNPEVSFLEGHSTLGPFCDMTPLSTPQTWEVFGNVPQWIVYRFCYSPTSFSQTFDFDIPAPTPFDTTTYVIAY